MATSSAPIVETVRKYITQLGNGRKIGHALRRLDRLDLTEPVMAETAVGRAVNAFRDHPEHGQLARDLIEKWISIAAEAKGIVMDEPTPSKKRPAQDSLAYGTTAASGLSFAETLNACNVPPVKKIDLSIKLTPLAANIPTPKTSVEEADDGLFAIERKHCRSKVYSGRQKSSNANGNNSSNDARSSSFSEIPENLENVKAASTSCMAPLNSSRGSTLLSVPMPRATAPAKVRPAPLMAKALKMMKNRHRY